MKSNKKPPVAASDLKKKGKYLMSILSRFVKPVKTQAENRADALKYALSHCSRDWADGIEVMTPDEEREMYNSGRENDGVYEPRGRYIVPQNDDSITAIDNRDGCAWSENFEKLGVALLWLEEKELNADDARALWDELTRGEEK